MMGMIPYVDVRCETCDVVVIDGDCVRIVGDACPYCVWIGGSSGTSTPTVCVDWRVVEDVDPYGVWKIAGRRDAEPYGDGIGGSSGTSTNTEIERTGS